MASIRERSLYGVEVVDRPRVTPKEHVTVTTTSESRHEAARPVFQHGDIKERPNDVANTPIQTGPSTATRPNRLRWALPVAAVAATGAAVGYAITTNKSGGPAPTPANGGGGGGGDNTNTTAGADGAKTKPDNPDAPSGGDLLSGGILGGLSGILFGKAKNSLDAATGQTLSFFLLIALVIGAIILMRK